MRASRKQATLVSVCGDGRRYDFLTETCCGGVVHKRDPTWTCCGIDWVSNDKFTCFLGIFPAPKVKRK